MVFRLHMSEILFETRLKTKSGRSTSEIVCVCRGDRAPGNDATTPYGIKHGLKLHDRLSTYCQN